MNKNTYIFDVCDTLFYSNTTFDYIKMFLKHKDNAKKLFIFNIINSRKSPVYFILTLFFKLTKIDLPRIFSIYLLKNFSKDDLYAFSNFFFNNYLKYKKITQTHDLLTTKKNENFNIILISSSIDPVINIISKNYKIKSFSSKLEYINNICTGKLDVDLTNKKQDILKNIDFNTLGVVTDNISDEKLMLLANEKIAVIHDKSKIDFWKKFKNIQYILLCNHFH